MARRVLFALIGLLFAAGLTACSTKENATDTASSATASSATASTVDAGAVAAAAGPAGSRAGACPTQAEVDGMQSELEAASGGETDIGSLAAEYEAAFSFLAAYLPPEHQADLDLVRNAFSGYVQALSGVDLSNPDALTPDQSAALDAAGQQFDTPEVEAANTSIEDYFSQTCPDVNFNSSSGSTDTTPN